MAMGFAVNTVKDGTKVCLMALRYLAVGISEKTKQKNFVLPHLFHNTMLLSATMITIINGRKGKTENARIGLPRGKQKKGARKKQTTMGTRFGITAVTLVDGEEKVHVPT